MKKLLQKKQWMMLSLVAALGLAVYLKYYFTKDPLLKSDPTGSAVVSSQTEGDNSRTLGETSFVEESAPESSDTSKTLPVQGKAEDNKTGSGNEASRPAEAGLQSGSYFDNARASRTKAREEAVRTLEDTLGGASSTAEQKSAAAKQASAIAENILQESNVENLVTAKGFSDCVAFIENGTCSVVVASAELKPQESLQILEIVMGQTGLPAKNVQITPVAGK